MTRILMKAAIAAVGALLLAGPALAAENWPDSFDQYMAKARGSISSINADAFYEVVKSPGNTLIVDVREPDEFASGHIPGAISIPRGLLEFRVWKVLGHPSAIDYNRKIVVYCLSGGRATLATRQLKELGFTNAIAVAMPLSEWQQKNYPLVK